MLNAAIENGIRYRITSTYRSVAKQKRLYQLFLAGRSRYPVAPPGRSKHNFGLAADLVTDDLPTMVQLARWAGLHWAGERDPVHFEMPD